MKNGADMSSAGKIVAWDFDGVLNRNYVDGRFLWEDNFEKDTGHSHTLFNKHVFRNDYEPIMSGREDLRDRVAGWADAVGYAHGVDALLAYWFERDVLPDPFTLDLMDRLDEIGVQQVIVTNNEALRANYIEHEMGFGSRVAHFFTSGRMGTVKPAPAFYHHVTDTLGVEPDDVFFVDDKLPNVEAAMRHGWQAMHFTDETRHRLEAFLPL